MVMTAQNRKLKPGYKQTEVGIIPEDWEVKKLSKVCNYQNGTSLERYFNEIQGLNVISIGNYSIDGKYIDTHSYIDRKYYEKIKKFILHPNELCMILNDKTSIGAIIGRVLLIEEDDKYVFNQRSMRIVPYESISSLYLYYIINSNLLHDKIISLAKPGTQIYVNTGDIIGLDIPIPKSPEEQTVIATVLSDTDSLIESLDKLIAKKRDIKQATMQQLLTGKRRLPGFSEEWEVKKLGQILRVCHGKSQSGVVVDDGKYPILATGGEIGRTNTYLYDKPSVLIGRKGTIDSPQYMDTPFWTIDTLFYTEILSRAHPKFVFYLFNRIEWLRYNEASGVPSLNASTIENIEVQCPPFPEQQAIASILSDMDAEITALEQKRNKARALKQGMMQELLTGKTRLI